MGKCGLDLSESGHGLVPEPHIVSFLKCLVDISFFKNLELFNLYEYKFLSCTIAL